MDDVRKIKIIEDLIADAEKLPHRGQNELDALTRNLRLAIRKLFGDDSHYLNELEEISFSPVFLL